ncbi:hypothetical protein BKA93DRAFT_747193 [Sparassis latifolia]
MGSKKKPRASASRASVASAASLVSRKVSKVTKSVKAGAKALMRPLKKARSALSKSRVSLRYHSSSSAMLINETSSKPVSVIDIDLDDVTEAASSQVANDEESPEAELARLQASWRSPVYSFFKLAEVSIDYDDEGRKYHFFPCAARQCKNKYKGVRRYQDSKDKSSTSNLKTHAMKCFGTAAVAAAIQGKSDTGKDGNAEVRAHLVKWLTESNRPSTIVEDREFVELMMAGRPNLDIPSCRTVSRDIHASFDRCQERIKKLLKSHTGDALGKAFHNMLVDLGIEERGASSELSDENDDDELPDLLSDSDDSDDGGDDEGESWDLSNLDDPEEVDELEELDVEEKSILLADTAAVRSTLVKKFKKATLFYSQDAVVTIANVIPSMDTIDEMLKPGIGRYEARKGDHEQPSDDEFGDFANISVTMEPSARNELEEYLAAPLEKLPPLQLNARSRKDGNCYISLGTDFLQNPFALRFALALGKCKWAVVEEEVDEQA